MSAVRLTRKALGRLAALPRVLRIALFALVMLTVVALAIPFALASSPAYIGRYADMKRSYETLQASAHRGLACGDCHVQEAGVASRLSSATGFYADLVKRPAAPSFSRMPTPAREACVRCHAEDWSDDAVRTMKIPHPAHLRVSTEERECVTCHKWTAHDEEYAERHKTMPFSGVCTSFGCHVGTKQADECSTCHHALEADQAVWIGSHRDVVRERGANACLEVCHEVDQCRICHTTGTKPDVGGPKRETGFQALQRAHSEPEWLEKHGAEALADDSKCIYCHVSTSECDSCHARRPAFHGPEETWLVEHKNHAEDERGCLTCHKKTWCEECHIQFEETS